MAEIYKLENLLAEMVDYEENIIKAPIVIDTVSRQNLRAHTKFCFFRDLVLSKLV